MQGDADIIAALNEQLTVELTAVNQYFLHAKMQDNWGYTKLAKHTRDESVDEMRHADRLAGRILFLEGLPNFQRINPLRIGQNVPEQLRSDLVIELEAVTRLRAGIDLMRSRGDVTSARLFEDILDDEEEHIDYLETEIALVEALGEPLYLQRYTLWPRHRPDYSLEPGDVHAQREVGERDQRRRHRGDAKGPLGGDWIPGCAETISDSTDGCRNDASATRRRRAPSLSSSLM